MSSFNSRSPPRHTRSSSRHTGEGRYPVSPPPERSRSEGKFEDHFLVPKHRVTVRAEREAVEV